MAKVLQDLIKLGNTSAIKSIYINSNTKEKKQLFIKMNILSTVQGETTFLKLFQHIGELQFYNYIMLKIRDQESSQYFYNAPEIINVEKELELKRSTQFFYLKLMTSKGLIIKVQNGIYKINTKYTS